MNWLVSGGKPNAGVEAKRLDDNWDVVAFGIVTIVAPAPEDGDCGGAPR